eukprot:TRINITY_DN39757_c0_g1_i1.p1 TRINITY_DN39757_c0_g1~~TRINITY_DN39757_c0_g1_i1.p1  ORF type:complete len:186 (+),score=11.03 TRINITY_DN39757_c0_g1_i1:204-761(+)
MASSEVGNLGISPKSSYRELERLSSEAPRPKPPSGRPPRIPGPQPRGVIVPTPSRRLLPRPPELLGHGAHGMQQSSTPGRNTSKDPAGSLGQRRRRASSRLAESKASARASMKAIKAARIVSMQYGIFTEKEQLERVLKAKDLEKRPAVSTHRDIVAETLQLKMVPRTGQAAAKSREMWPRILSL